MTRTSPRLPSVGTFHDYEEGEGAGCQHPRRALAQDEYGQAYCRSCGALEDDQPTPVTGANPDWCPNGCGPLDEWKVEHDGQEWRFCLPDNRSGCGYYERRKPE